MKKKRLYVLLGCLLLVLALGAVGVGFLLNKDEPVMNDVGIELYWNIDRDEYVGDSSAGINSRERAEDGFYKVRFAVGGERVEYNVKKARLMHEIDEMDVMGLAIDEEGTITDVFDPEDITGGEVASMYYVVFGSDASITVCPNEDLEDDYQMLTVTENTGIYNVIGMDPVGYEDTALPSDQIRAFQNKEGEITHVFIVSRYGYWPGEVVQKQCEHCDELVDWYVWEEKYSLPTETGHWILENDVKATAQHKILANQQVIIDLNGKTVKSSENKRVYAMTGENSFLAIMDSSAKGTGTVIGRGAPSNGGIVLVRYGTFELYGGTLDASNIATLQYGSAVRVNKDAVFNMYNGTVIGGTSVGSMNAAETSTTGGYGGTIQVGGTFNLYDGVVRDGRALGYVKKDGSIICGNGGNIHIGTDGIFNMYGGSILNGTADRAGGNIYMGKNAVVNMSDGTISGGIVADDDRYGGNVFINANAQAFNLSGGTIEKGKALGAGGNIALYGTLNMNGGTVKDGSCMTGKTIAEGVHNEEYPHHNIYCAGGTLNMAGGLVKGYLRIRDTSSKECTINLSGTAQIKGGSINLSLDPGDDVNIGTLQKGADICINGGGYVSTNTAQANTNYVRSSYEGVETQYIDNKIFIGKQACVCGHTDQHIGDCKGTILDWIPWGTTTSMPAAEANWYLVCDVTMKNQVKIEEKANFRLDLNGHKVTSAENMRVYALRNGGINMVVTDLSTEKDGVIIARGKDMGRGNCIWVSDNGSLTMYGGTLDASKASAIYGGTTLTVDETSKVVMYDGTIIGGKSVYLVNEKGEKQNGFGGAVAVYGTFDMNGGKITGGYSEGNGGNVYVTKNGNFTLAGGEVLNGVANLDNTTAGCGGNIYVNGQFTMKKGAIKNGHARQGGNVYLKAATVFNLSGGTVEDGCAGKEGAPGTGGNLVALGAFNMTGGNISGGKILGKEDQAAANVYTKSGDKGCTFTMTGGTIAGLVKANHAGTVTLGGTARIINDNGDVNLTLANNATISINGLKEGALFGVNPQYDTYFASGAVSGDESYFKPDKQYKLIELVENDKLIIVPDWEPWTKTDSLPTKSGMYYLTGNVTVDAAASIEEATVSLDLRGYTVETSKDVETIPRVYVLKESGTLNIYDTSTEETGKIISHRKYSAHAGVLEVRGEGATLNLYGGTVDASDVELPDRVTGEGEQQEITYYYGAAVYVNSNTTFNMYGGKIIGGKACNGGSVYVNVSATFNMEDGIITDGKATNQGGNISVSNHSSTPGKFIMSGGSITNGEAMTGGNVLATGVFDMSGGTISGGIATSNQTGGNVYTIPGNKGCTFTMSGGTIDGFVRANFQGSITLSGSAKIKGGATNLTLTAQPASIITSGLNADAEIYVNPEYVTYYIIDSENKLHLSCFAEIEKAEDINRFTADDGSIVELVDGNKLILVKEWTSATTLPTTTGNYRLINEVTPTAAAVVAKDATVYLDLNGYDVTATNRRIYQFTNTGATVGIYNANSDKTGEIETIRAATGTGAGGLIYMNAKDSTFNLYGGILKANLTLSANGGVVLVNTNCEFNMYGGTIIGGTANQGGSVYVTADGSNPGIFNMYGGTITGGTAATGGNIAALGVFNMTGGTISDGTATNTSSKTSGNVYTKPGADGCTFMMSGGTIEGLVKVNYAGSVTLSGTAKITTGTYGDATNPVACGLHIAKTGATIVIGSKGFAEGAAIYLNTNDSEPGILVSGKIEEAYQSYFRPCGIGRLEFKDDGIYVEE